MIGGKTITVLAVAWGDQLEKTEKALEHCVTTFPVFDQVKFIKEIDNEIDYNRFFVEKLNNIIFTDFVLNIQADGFIINPKLWSDNFLNYDYIGAPWPWHRFCGNGGFSLRSKKFLQLSSSIKYDSFHNEYQCAPEDWFLCVKNRDFFIKNLIKFADIKTASNFSFEHPIGIKGEGLANSFGFHGKHNLKT